MMTAEILKTILESNEYTKVLIGSLIITKTLDGQFNPATEIKICLKLIDTILRTSPTDELKQVVIDYVVDEVMKMQQQYGKTYS
jgi:hypothetical protein